MKTDHTHITFIVGPTASGKSTLALQYAKVNNCNILSADSRQVYQGIEITSGADIPSQFDFVETPVESRLIAPLPQGYFWDGETNIYGISSLHPTEVWSIGLFRELANYVFAKSFAEKKGVVIVGGSGLYTHSLLLEHDQLKVPPNQRMRESLEENSIEELQEMVEAKYPKFAQTFNPSDWSNKRRLVRSLEILSTQPVNNVKKEIDNVENFIEFDGTKINPKWIGIYVEKNELEQRIEKRVKERISSGAVQEVERLASVVNDRQAPIFTTTGVKEILGFLNGQYDEGQLIELWARREFQYAKRQMTWFKKRNYIEWQDN